MEGQSPRDNPFLLISSMSFSDDKTYFCEILSCIHIDCSNKSSRSKKIIIKGPDNYFLLKTNQRRVTKNNPNKNFVKRENIHIPSFFAIIPSPNNQTKVKAFQGLLYNPIYKLATAYDQLLFSCGQGPHFPSFDCYYCPQQIRLTSLPLCQKRKYQEGATKKIDKTLF